MSALERFTVLYSQTPQYTNNKAIDYNTFHSMLSQLPSTKTHSDHEHKSLFTALDTNHSGTVSFQSMLSNQRFLKFLNDITLSTSIPSHSKEDESLRHKIRDIFDALKSDRIRFTEFEVKIRSLIDDQLRVILEQKQSEIDHLDAEYERLSSAFEALSVLNTMTQEMSVHDDDVVMESMELHLVDEGHIRQKMSSILEDQEIDGSVASYSSTAESKEHGHILQVDMLYDFGFSVKMSLQKNLTSKW